MYSIDNTNYDELEVLQEQTAQLYASVNKAIIATLINSSILVAVLWNAVAHFSLLAWLALIFLVSLARGIDAYRFNKYSIPLEQAGSWRNRFLAGSVSASILWGASSLFIFPDDDLARQVFLAFVIGGMVAAAITTLSYVKIASYLFLSFALVPLIVRFFTGHAELDIAMGTMLSLYFIMMLQSAKLTHEKYIDNIRTKIKNLQQSRSLNESEHRYKTLLETATDAFFLHDMKGNILDVNQQACRSLGFSKDELLELTVADIDTEVSTAGISWDSLKEGENLRFDSRHRRKDGSTFPVEVSLGLIYIGDEPVVSVLARDITDRKRMEKMKNEFVSTVSHELRTPLTSIRGGLGLLNGGALGEMPEQAKEILKIASHNADTLLVLVNDILDMQKIESGDFKMELRKLELMSFLREVIEDNKAYVEQFNVDVKLEPFSQSLYINADKERLKQVMANLLSNAAKFSDANSTINVSVTLPADDIVRLSVKDHGVGIAEEFYPTIFDKFTQQDSSDTRQKGGTGLGLSITKAIVEKHGGEIAFTSEEGKGTTFYFDLPRLNSENHD